MEITQPRQADRLPLLTGLRGLAALIVLASHAAIVGYLPSFLGHGFGQVGVMIFFILSGFLMAHLYIRKEPTRDALDSYARARVGRVLPLYFLVVVISIIVSNSLQPEFRYSLPLDDPAQILRAFLLIEAPWELWTIPVEVQFYLTFAFAWLLYPRLGWWAVAAMGALVSLPAAVYMALLGAKPSILPTYGFAFVIGSLIALALPRLKERLSRVPGFVALVFFVLLFINTPELRGRTGTAVADGSLYISTWLDPITWAVVLGLFVCCVLGSSSLRFLDSRPFKFFGEISYGLYLLHYPILEISARLIGVNFVGLVVASTGSITLAWASLRFFEAPILTRIRGPRARRRGLPRV